MTDQQQNTSNQLASSALLRAIAPQIRYMTPLLTFLVAQAGRALGKTGAEQETASSAIKAHEGWLRPFYSTNKNNRWYNIISDGINFGVVALIDRITLRPRKQEMCELFAGAIAKQSGGAIAPAAVTFKDIAESDNPFIRIPATKLNRLIGVSMLANLPAAIGAILPLAEEAYGRVAGLDANRQRIMPDALLGTNTMVGATVLRAFWEAVHGESRVFKNIRELRHEADRPIETVKSDVLEYLYNSCVDELAKEQRVGLFGKIKHFITKPFRKAEATPEDPMIFWKPQHIEPSDKYTKGMLAYMAECVERTQKQRYDVQGKHLELGFDEAIMLMPWINKDHPKITEYVIRSVAHGGASVMQDIQARLGAARQTMGRVLTDEQKNHLANLYENELRQIYTGVIAQRLTTSPKVEPVIELVVDGQERYAANAQTIAELIGADRLKYYLKIYDAEGAPGPNAGSNGRVFTLTNQDFSQLLEKIRGRANEETNSYDTNKNPMLLKSEVERDQLLQRAIIGRNGRQPLVDSALDEDLERHIVIEASTPTDAIISQASAVSTTAHDRTSAQLAEQSDNNQRHIA